MVKIKRWSIWTGSTDTPVSWPHLIRNFARLLLQEASQCATLNQCLNYTRWDNSWCCKISLICSYFQTTPGSLHSLPHYSSEYHPQHPQQQHQNYFLLSEHVEETDSSTVVSRRSPSVDDSLVSDYDSGAFSRNSTPTCHQSRVTTPDTDLLTPRMRSDKFHRDVSPLVSPPLVLSVTRQSRMESRTQTLSRGQTCASPVTVTIGSTTRLCINETDKYQSLPNLALLKRSDTGVTSGHKMTRMPHMGTSRLTTPPRPGRVRSVMMNNSQSSVERPRITTSTAALLSRSNTSVSVFKQPVSPTSLRFMRDGSCGSDTSSGVFSVTSSSDHCPMDQKIKQKSRVDKQQHYRVTVNGQHLEAWRMIHILIWSAPGLSTPELMIHMFKYGHQQVMVMTNTCVTFQQIMMFTYPWAVDNFVLICPSEWSDSVTWHTNYFFMVIIKTKWSKSKIPWFLSRDEISNKKF